MAQSTRARLGLVQGAKVAFGCLSVILGLGTRKGGEGKGKGNQGSGRGRDHKKHKESMQAEETNDRKVVFCLQIVCDITMFTWLVVSGASQGEAIGDGILQSLCTVGGRGGRGGRVGPRGSPHPRGLGAPCRKAGAMAQVASSFTCACVSQATRPVGPPVRGLGRPLPPPRWVSHGRPCVFIADVLDVTVTGVAFEWKAAGSSPAHAPVVKGNVVVRSARSTLCLVHSPLAHWHSALCARVVTNAGGFGDDSGLAQGQRRRARGPRLAAPPPPPPAPPAMAHRRWMSLHSPSPPANADVCKRDMSGSIVSEGHKSACAFTVRLVFACVFEP